LILLLPRSKHGDDGQGYPEYGLRFFTIQPGGQIPIHNHFYHQTMFILSGDFECWDFDPETDEIKEKFICGPGTAVYISSLAPHGMKNIGTQASRNSPKSPFRKGGLEHPPRACPATARDQGRNYER
jgi:quercetin dioxygenase-like cupin family protein